MISMKRDVTAASNIFFKMGYLYALLLTAKSVYEISFTKRKIQKTG